MNLVCLFRLVWRRPYLSMRRWIALLLLFTIHFSMVTCLDAQVPGILNYQGRVVVNGTNFNGTGQFKFALVDGGTNLAQQTFWSNGASAVSLAVTKGLYALLLGDTTMANMTSAIPVSTFTNADVRLRVWFNDGVSGSQQLTPDQRLAAVGYALMAGSVATGAITSAQLANGAVGSAQLASNLTINGALTAGSFSGNGAGLTNVGTVGSAAVSNVNLSVQTLSNTFWRLTGNAGTTPGAQFIGTTDNQPLELAVNNTRALLLNPTPIDFNNSGIVNIIGGSAANLIADGVRGSVIGGGGAVKYNGLSLSNSVAADFSVLGGGYNNTIQSGAYQSLLGGGNDNTIQNDAYNSTLGGGYGNTIQSFASHAVLGGGYGNTIQTNSYQSTLGGGYYNTIQNDAYYATLGGGYGNTILNNAWYAILGGGHNNTNGAMYATLGGGEGNTIVAGASGATLGGGQANAILINSFRSVLGGGAGNTIQAGAMYSTLGGGYSNTIQTSAYKSTLGGGASNTIQTGAYLAMLGGGQGNAIQNGSDHATLGGGQGNMIGVNAGNSVLGGGVGNTIGFNANIATISGGASNAIQARSLGAIMGGGLLNTIQNDTPLATLCGGYENSIQSNAPYATLGGGHSNTILYGAAYATLGGGDGNLANGMYATVPGGASNAAVGNYSFAAGRQAKANYRGSFVWGDSTAADVADTTNDQFVVRANGGVVVKNPIWIGSGTNTTDAPDKPLIIRRIGSRNNAAGQVLARTDAVTLERDGFYGGMRIGYQASPGIISINFMGLSSTGTSVNFSSVLTNPASPGTMTIYSDAQNVVFFHGSFGDTYYSGHLSEVTLQRFPGDNYWYGTLTSTFNQ